MFLLFFASRMIACFEITKKTVGDKKETAAVPSTAETGEGIPRLMGRMLHKNFYKSRGNHE